MRQHLFLLACLVAGVFSKTPSVLIIGAGPSGIAAATKLLENSITNITILEAENRIGGRIYSVPIQDGYVDIGAEYCHGQVGNVVYEKVKDLNLLRHSYPSLKKLYYSNGSKVDHDLAEEIKTLVDRYDQVIDRSSDKLSLGENFFAIYNSTIGQKYINDSQRLPIVIEAIKFVEHVIIKREGTFSWNRPSAGRHYQYCKGDNTMAWINGGYNTILKVLTKNHPNLEDKINLNKQVSKIIWNGQKAQILTTDNSSYTADHVIFTASIGVLKHSHDLFDPVLPENKRKAIDAIGLDAIIKIIMHFPKKWWDDSFFLFLWSDEDIWKSAEKFPLGYSKNGVSWVTSVYALSQAVNPNVLIAWVSGDLVPEIEQIPEDIIEEGVSFVIHKFLGNDYNITKADKIIRSQWYSNPNFRGTYSFEKNGYFDKAISRQAIIAEPLHNKDGKPIVQFAGEATNPVHYSTVHGAIETGWKEAQTIINLYT